MQEQKALTREASKRYRQAKKKEKPTILDEVVKTTGYNREYAVHLLANGGKTAGIKACDKKRKKGGGRKPVYTEEFATALRAIWVFFWYRCGKILAPFMREQMRGTWNRRFASRLRSGNCC